MHPLQSCFGFEDTERSCVYQHWYRTILLELIRAAIDEMHFITHLYNLTKLPIEKALDYLLT
jgi:hypothetical protein